MLATIPNYLERRPDFLGPLPDDGMHGARQTGHHNEGAAGSSVSICGRFYCWVYTSLIYLVSKVNQCLLGSVWKRVQV